MPVLSGRAKSGVRSVLRTAFVGVAAIVGLLGCGNDNFTYGTPLITFSVVPGPFTAYIAELYQITMTRSDGNIVYPLISPQIVDFTKLNDMPEVFGAPAILEGTYTSATITLSYAADLYQLSGAAIYMDVNGTSTAVTPVDSTGAAASTVTYTVKFDPAHPFVVKHGVSTPLDFNFDLSASALVNTATSPRQLIARPFMTASTQPNYTKPMRARGIYVTTDTANNNFTVNARSFFDVAGQGVGAIEIQTDSNTQYNINGTIYTGAAGLAAVNKLQINSIVEAYGTFGDLNNIKPNFVATQVFAGVAVENVLTTRITGTVSSRSGTTLHIKGAELDSYNGSTPIGEYVSFQDDLTLTVGPDTLVNVDGHPELQNITADYLSVGQQVDTEALLVTEADGTTVVKDANGNATWSVANGLARLIPTVGWGVLSSTSGSGLVTNLTSLGGFAPSTLTFTGTNSDPAAYAISATGIDTSAVTAGSVFRFDGLVSPFGTAPPDFVADSVTPVSATDQIMTIQWPSAGTAAPFITKDSNGLVVNVLAGAPTSALVQSGPLYVQTAATATDLTTLATNPTIVADAKLISQFSVGNPTSTATTPTGVALFNDYTSFLTDVNTVVNGTNTFPTLVAVGKYDAASNTFTAYRIDMVQLP